VTLAARLIVRSLLMLVGSLAVIGVGTGVLLHAERLRALDRTLLEAAHASAHPDPGGSWDVEYSRSDVHLQIWTPEEAPLPRAWIEDALTDEQPRTYDLDGRRTLVLVAEEPAAGEPGSVPVEPEAEHHETHYLVVASAVRPTLAQSIGSFATAYAGVALLVALLAVAVQRRLVLGALAPLAWAQSEVAIVVKPGQGARVTEEGPAEVRTLLRAVNALLDRLDEAAHAQARFTAEAAHELRTPVTSLLGQLEVTLRRPRPTDEYRACLESLLEEVQGLRRLVEGLTDLARLDGGDPGVARSLRWADVVTAAVERCRSSAGGAGTTLELDVQCGDVAVVGHQALLEAAVGNLVSNALSYGAGRVRVAATREADGLRVDVRDDGPGVPAAEWEGLFDRFARGRSARRSNPEGLGLGLPFAREVARRHGGDCWIEEPEGGGCLAALTVGAEAWTAGAPPAG